MSISDHGRFKNENEHNFSSDSLDSNVSSLSSVASTEPPDIAAPMDVLQRSTLTGDWLSVDGRDPAGATRRSRSRRWDAPVSLSLPETELARGYELIEPALEAREDSEWVVISEASECDPYSHSRKPIQLCDVIEDLANQKVLQIQRRAGRKRERRVRKRSEKQ